MGHYLLFHKGYNIKLRNDIPPTHQTSRKAIAPQKQQQRALQLAEQRSNVGLLFDELPNVVDGKPFLRHAVTVTDGHNAALQSLVVDVMHKNVPMES